MTNSLPFVVFRTKYGLYYFTEAHMEFCLQTQLAGILYSNNLILYCIYAMLGTWNVLIGEKTSPVICNNLHKGDTVTFWWHNQLLCWWPKYYSPFNSLGKVHVI